MRLEFDLNYEEQLPGCEVALGAVDEGIFHFAVHRTGAREPYDSYAIVRTHWPRLHHEGAMSFGDVGGWKIGLVASGDEIDGLSISGPHRDEILFSRISCDEERITLERKMHHGERVYGYGEMGEALRKEGRRHRIWNTDDPSHHPLQQYYCQIPFSLHFSADGKWCWGLFFDNPGEQIHDLGYSVPGLARYDFPTGSVFGWVIVGSSPEEVVEKWTQLTGRIHRPPMWALGYQQCRWSYHPDDEVRDIAREFRERRIPCDTIYLDIHYMYGYRVFTWSPKEFPLPDKLIADLGEQGFRVITIVDPGVKIDETYQLYKDFIERPGFFLGEKDATVPYTGEVWPGEVHLPDFTREDVRQRWGGYQDMTLLDKGIAGIWNDMNEPADFLGTEKHRDLVHYDFGRNRTHREIHQVYGQTMAQASYEGLRTARPGERPFVLTRSGWAGVQRYSAVWTGDNESLWDNMGFGIALNIGMGISGVPFVGGDVGGFGRDASAALFERWMSWGIFQPLCRGHSALHTRQQEPWAFGKEVEDACREYLNFRMQLLPYLYTQFVLASETGVPVNRPLFWAHASDGECHGIGDQFLVGPDLMVAPVLQADVSTRAAYFPGGEWVDWSTSARRSGWQLVRQNSGQLPLHVRAGAILPLHPVRQHTRELEPSECFLHVFPAPAMEGLLIEDDGISFDYEAGREARTHFTGTDTEEVCHMVIHAPDGDYQSARREWVVVLRTSRPVRSISIDSQPIKGWDTRTDRVEFRFPDTRAKIDVRVHWAA